MAASAHLNSQAGSSTRQAASDPKPGELSWSDGNASKQGPPNASRKQSLADGQLVKSACCTACRSFKTRCWPNPADTEGPCLRCQKMQVQCDRTARKRGRKRKLPAQDSGSLDTNPEDAKRKAAGPSYKHAATARSNSGDGIGGHLQHALQQAGQGVNTLDLTSMQKYEQNKMSTSGNMLELPDFLVSHSHNDSSDIFRKPGPASQTESSDLSDLFSANQHHTSTPPTTSIFQGFADRGHSIAEGLELVSTVADSQHRSSGSGSKHSFEDPVQTGAVSELEADNLVKYYFNHLQDCICLLDPQLHTRDYMRQHARVLFLSVLAVAAKFSASGALYQLLLSKAKDAIKMAMFQPLYDIEIIQSICILVYWKNATDDSGWLWIGHACRLGFKLGLHQMDTSLSLTESPLARQIMDKQRTWISKRLSHRTTKGMLTHLVHFVFQHFIVVLASRKPFVAFELMMSRSSEGTDNHHSETHSLPPNIQPIHLPNIDVWLAANSEYHLPCDGQLAYVVGILHAKSTYASISSTLANKVILKSILASAACNIRSHNALWTGDNPPIRLAPLSKAIIRFYSQCREVIIEETSMRVANPQDHEVQLGLYINALLVLLDIVITDFVNTGYINTMQDLIVVAIASSTLRLVRCLANTQPEIQSIIVSKLSLAASACQAPGRADPSSAAAYLNRFIARLLGRITKSNGTGASTPHRSTPPPTVPTALAPEHQHQALPLEVSEAPAHASIDNTNHGMDLFRLDDMLTTKPGVFDFEFEDSTFWSLAAPHMLDNVDSLLGGGPLDLPPPIPSVGFDATFAAQFPWPEMQSFDFM